MNNSIVLEEQDGQFWDPEQLRWRKRTKATEKEIKNRYGGKHMLEFIELENKHKLTRLEKTLVQRGKRTA